jgi:hypothetical protein
MLNATCEKMTAGLEAVRSVVDFVRENGRVMTGAIRVFMYPEMDRPVFDRLMALVVRTGQVRWEGRCELIWVTDPYATTPNGFEEIY